MEAVIYPIGLCLIVGMIYLAYDFGRVCKKYKKLELMKLGTELLAEYLPQAESLEEDAYQQMVCLLCEQQQEMQSAMEQKYSDMIGYYTVWVHQIKTPIAAMRLNLQNEDTPLSRKISGEFISRRIQLKLDEIHTSVITDDKNVRLLHRKVCYLLS